MLGLTFRLQWSLCASSKNYQSLTQKKMTLTRWHLVQVVFGVAKSILQKKSPAQYQMMQREDKSDVIHQTLFHINLMSKAQGPILIT